MSKSINLNSNNSQTNYLMEMTAMKHLVAFEESDFGK